MAVLAPSDYAAYSDATGAEFASTAAEKAAQAPAVLRWKESKARARESEKKEGRGPSVMDVLVAAGIVGGAGAGAYGLKRYFDGQQPAAPKKVQSVAGGYVSPPIQRTEPANVSAAAANVGNGAVDPASDAATTASAAVASSDPMTQQLNQVIERAGPALNVKRKKNKIIYEQSVPEYDKKGSVQAHKSGSYSLDGLTRREIPYSNINALNKTEDGRKWLSKTIDQRFPDRKENRMVREEINALVEVDPGGNDVAMARYEAGDEERKTGSTVNEGIGQSRTKAIASSGTYFQLPEEAAQHALMYGLFDKKTGARIIAPDKVEWKGGKRVVVPGMPVESKTRREMETLMKGLDKVMPFDPKEKEKYPNLGPLNGVEWKPVGVDKSKVRVFVRNEDNSLSPYLGDREIAFGGEGGTYAPPVLVGPDGKRRPAGLSDLEYYPTDDFRPYLPKRYQGITDESMKLLIADDRLRAQLEEEIAQPHPLLSLADIVENYGSKEDVRIMPEDQAAKGLSEPLPTSMRRKGEEPGEGIDSDVTVGSTEYRQRALPSANAAELGHAEINGIRYAVKPPKIEMVRVMHALQNKRALDSHNGKASMTPDEEMAFLTEIAPQYNTTINDIVNYRREAVSSGERVSLQPGWIKKEPVASGVLRVAHALENENKLQESLGKPRMDVERAVEFIREMAPNYNTSAQDVIAHINKGRVDTPPTPYPNPAQRTGWVAGRGRDVHANAVDAFHTAAATHSMASELQVAEWIDEGSDASIRKAAESLMPTALAMADEKVLGSYAGKGVSSEARLAIVSEGVTNAVRDLALLKTKNPEAYRRFNSTEKGGFTLDPYLKGYVRNWAVASRLIADPEPSYNIPVGAWVRMDDEASNPEFSSSDPTGNQRLGVPKVVEKIAKSSVSPLQTVLRIDTLASGAVSRKDDPNTNAQPIVDMLFFDADDTPDSEGRKLGAPVLVRSGPSDINIKAGSELEHGMHGRYSTGLEASPGYVEERIKAGLGAEYRAMDIRHMPTRKDYGRFENTPLKETGGGHVFRQMANGIDNSTERNNVDIRKLNEKADRYSSQEMRAKLERERELFNNGYAGQDMQVGRGFALTTHSGFVDNYSNAQRSRVGLAAVDIRPAKAGGHVNIMGGSEDDGSLNMANRAESEASVAKGLDQELESYAAADAGAPVDEAEAPSKTWKEMTPEEQNREIRNNPANKMSDVDAFEPRRKLRDYLADMERRKMEEKGDRYVQKSVSRVFDVEPVSDEMSELMSRGRQLLSGAPLTKEQALAAGLVAKPVAARDRTDFSMTVPVPEPGSYLPSQRPRPRPWDAPGATYPATTRAQLMSLRTRGRV